LLCFLESSCDRVRGILILHWLMLVRKPHALNLRPFSTYTAHIQPAMLGCFFPPKIMIL
jgi:hypothetical protein